MFHLLRFTKLSLLKNVVLTQSHFVIKKKIVILRSKFIVYVKGEK